MKKIGTAMMAMVLASSLSGCGDSGKSEKKNKKVDPQYLEEEALEYVETCKELKGNIKALGNYYDYDDTLLLTNDKRLVWTDFDKISNEIKVPKDVKEIADIHSGLIFLRHSDGNCSAYDYDDFEDTCTLKREDISLPDNCYASSYEDGTIVAYYNKESDVVFDIYPTDSSEPNGCTGKMSIDVLTENGIEYSGVQMYMPKGDVSYFLKEVSTGRVFVSTLGSGCFIPSISLTSENTISNPEHCEFSCSDRIRLENCDKILSYASCTYYTLTNDTTHVYKVYGDDELSDGCEAIELSDGYTTADIEETIGIGSDLILRMEDGKVLSSSYDSTKTVLNPELTELFNDGNIIDYMFDDDDLYIVMDDHHLYTLNLSVIYKYGE